MYVITSVIKWEFKGLEIVRNCLNSLNEDYKSKHMINKLCMWVSGTNTYGINIVLRNNICKQLTSVINVKLAYVTKITYKS